MSLRDWFAGQALGLFGSTETLVAIREQAKASHSEESLLLARAAYDVADAMLAERVKMT